MVAQTARLSLESADVHVPQCILHVCVLIKQCVCPLSGAVGVGQFPTGEHTLTVSGGDSSLYTAS